jgi:hypothetical protein
VDLKSRLIEAAEAWAAAWAASEGAEVPPTRLAKRVMDDGKFFDWLAESRKGPSIATLERFGRFLTDPANWPDGRVADAAEDFAHVIGVSFDEGATPDGSDSSGPATKSPDMASDSIGSGGFELTPPKAKVA